MTTHKNTNQGQGSKQAETPAPDALPEIADLVRDFADLWQEQLSAMAADPSLAAGMTETMKLWQQGLAMMGGTPPKTPDQAGRYECRHAGCDDHRAERLDATAIQCSQGYNWYAGQWGNGKKWR